MRVSLNIDEEVSPHSLVVPAPDDSAEVYSECKSLGGDSSVGDSSVGDVPVDNNLAHVELNTEQRAERLHGVV